MRADAGGGALHLGDHRDLAVEDRVDGPDRTPEHHPAALTDHPLGRVGRPLRLGRGRAAAQVGAGAEEAAGRLEHDATDGEVLVGAGEPLAHLHALVAGERVARLGPVDGDGGDAVGDLEADAVEVLGIAHACSCSTAPGAPGGRIVYSILL